MISSRLAFSLGLVSAVALSGGLLAQQGSIPANSFRAAANVPSPPRAVNSPTNITPELRGDIYMARKMYREAIDMYRECPPDSAVIANKIGIAYHQMMQLDIAGKYFLATRSTTRNLELGNREMMQTTVMTYCGWVLDRGRHDFVTPATATPPWEGAFCPLRMLLHRHTEIS